MSSEALLRLAGVEATYPGRRSSVLSHLDLEVGAGEVLGVSGTSGSGKTTLLRMLAGLVPATGTVTWVGARRPDLAYCPQDDVLLGYRSVWENAALLLERPASGGSAGGARPTLARLLSDVGLIDVASELPGTLSGGMRQRVQVVQALVAPSALMMLDEPFSQQDRDRQRDLEDLVFASVRDRGQTALIVSHDLDALAAICDRIVLLGGSPARVVGDLRTPSDLTRLPPARRRAAADFVRHNEQVWHERARVALA